MKGGPKSSLRPFLHRALQMLIMCEAVRVKFYSPRSLITWTHGNLQEQLKPSFHVIAHDCRIAENSASDRQRLYGNSFQRSGNRQ